MFGLTLKLQRVKVICKWWARNRVGSLPLRKQFKGWGPAQSLGECAPQAFAAKSTFSANLVHFGFDYAVLFTICHVHKCNLVLLFGHTRLPKLCRFNNATSKILPFNRICYLMHMREIWLISQNWNKTEVKHLASFIICNCIAPYKLVLTLLA